MVWRDGIPAQGLSGLGWQGRGEYPITYCSQGNEKIVLFVEMACNGLFGAGYPVPHDPPNMNKYYTLKQVFKFYSQRWKLVYLIRKNLK
jgi:alpha-mannosidase